MVKVTGHNTKNRKGQRLGSFYFAVIFGSLGLSTLPDAIILKNSEYSIITSACILAAVVSFINGIFSPRYKLFKADATRRQRLIGTAWLLTIPLGTLGIPVASVGLAVKINWLAILGIGVFLVSLVVCTAIMGYALVNIIRDAFRSNHDDTTA